MHTRPAQDSARSELGAQSGRVAALERECAAKARDCAAQARELHRLETDLDETTRYVGNNNNVRTIFCIMCFAYIRYTVTFCAVMCYPVVYLNGDFAMCPSANFACLVGVLCLRRV